MQRKCRVEALNERRRDALVPSGVGFDDFVRGRGPALLRFAYLLTSDQGQAEDLVQRALIKAYRRWDHVASVAHPDAYVRRVVLNEHLSFRRRRSSSEVVGPVPDAAQRDVTDDLADRDLVWRVLGQLPRRQRSVLVLRYYEALPDREIAALLGCREGTVRSLAARAFETLRRHPQLAREREEA
jgi:RNA polymerase sigma-70 factor (sigma-E family)